MALSKSPTKVCIWDFDGTLVMSPHDTTLVKGVPARELYDNWLVDMGKPPRKWLGWWGRPETLMVPIFGEYDADGKFVAPQDLLNHELAELCKSHQDEEDTLNVLMTGRHMKMRHPEIKEHVCKIILDAYGLTFDRYYYGSTGQPTLTFKCNAVQAILREFPSIDDVEFWEDREAHVSEFWNFIKFLKKQGRIKVGKVNQVYGVDYNDMGTTE